MVSRRGNLHNEICANLSKRFGQRGGSRTGKRTRTGTGLGSSTRQKLCANFCYDLHWQWPTSECPTYPISGRFWSRGGIDVGLIER